MVLILPARPQASQARSQPNRGQSPPTTGRFTSTDPVPPPVGDPAVAPYVYASDQATRLTDPTGEFPCLLGRNPDGGCRGGHEAHVAGQFAQGAGAAGRDFFLGLAAPDPVRGQRIIDGAKVTLSDCYAGLTSTADPVSNCLRQASGLTDLIQGLTLAFHGCVYIGAYIATGGAIQLTLSLAPLGAGRALAAGEVTGAAAEDAATGGLIPGRAATGTGYRAGIDATKLRMSKTVESHIGEYSKDGTLARPYADSRLTVQNIMDAVRPTPDPGGVPGALRWDVPGTMNGSSGTWELVVDPNTNTILHFLFRSSR